MEGSGMFKKDQDFSAVMASLSPGQRTAFIVLAIGGIFPVLFLGIIRPIYWGVAFQMACLTGLAYIRWRSPAFGGSVWVMAVAGLACIASLAAAVTA
jgi:hypothetical protein